MKKELPYTVCCELTLADFQEGRIISTRQVQEYVLSQTAELNELLTDLYEQFRCPYLLGLQITAIHCQHPSQAHVLESRNS
jgi:hypothetical protein